MGPVDCLYLSSCAVCVVSICRIFNSSYGVCYSLGRRGYGNAINVVCTRGEW